MPRRYKNNKPKNNFHRGGSGGRGRGRGGPYDVSAMSPEPPTGRGPRHRYPHSNTEIDVVIQQWAEPSTAPGAVRGGNVNRGNGPWRGGTPKSRSGSGTPLRGGLTPNGNGVGRGRGRGVGRGRGWDNRNDPFSSPRGRSRFGGVGTRSRFVLGKDAPLSDLLNAERPLLRPIKFVRATLTPFLFQHSDDVLKPATQTVDTSHVPTANSVAQLFHNNAADSDSEPGDVLEEIDFADLAKVRAEIDAIAQATASMANHNAHGDIEEVDFADLAAIRARVDAAALQTYGPSTQDGIIEEVFTGAYNGVKDSKRSISSPTLPTHDGLRGSRPSKSVDILNPPAHDSFRHARGSNAAEDSPDTSLDVDEPSPSEASETYVASTTSPALDESLDPKPSSINILNLSARESFSSTRDAIVVEEEASCSINARQSALVEESSPPTMVETRHVPITSPTSGDLLGLKPPIDLLRLFFPQSLAHARDADNSFGSKPSIEISTPCTQDATVVEGAPDLSDTSTTVPIDEPSRSIATVPLADGVPLRLDAPPQDDPRPLFIVDTAPTRPFTDRSASDDILIHRIGHGETLGEPEDDDDCIVYLAPRPNPHSRSGRAALAPRPGPSQTSMLTGRPLDVAPGGPRSPVREDDVQAVSDLDRDRGPPRASVDGETGEAEEGYHLSLASLTIGPTPSTSAPAAMSPPAPPPSAKVARKAHQKKAKVRRRRERQKKQARMGFGAFGAMMSEAQLREEDVKERERPEWETRRRGDSDVEWGSEDESKSEEGEGSSGLGGMDVDPDLEISAGAMLGFLKSMSTEGSQHVTMDDIDDEARMRQEDEEGEGGPDGSSDFERSDEEDAEADSEEEEAFNIEEGVFIGESEDEELSEDSDDDDDEELSPDSRFQARLLKVRERSHSQQPKPVQGANYDDENGDDAHDTDEGLLAYIREQLEADSRTDVRRDRVDAQEFLSDPEFTTPVHKKGKGKQATGYFAAELKAQWAKDRAKKAARKREREVARLLAALDPLGADAKASASGHRPARASEKTMRAATRLDPDAARSIAPDGIVVPTVSVDVVAIEAYVRRFVEDVGGRTSLAFPPMAKETRKMVHEMADAFGLTSVSKGSGARRYTTLFKTTRTGIGKGGRGSGRKGKGVNEGKVKKLMKRWGGRKGGGVPRHREGDEVGKEAPKIGESNVGFRMLAAMGWSEGRRIGGAASAGIEAPLAAIIKHSKLGLGATR